MLTLFDITARECARKFWMNFLGGKRKMDDVDNVNNVKSAKISIRIVNAETQFSILLQLG
jgi:hypothetical protein